MSAQKRRMHAHPQHRGQGLPLQPTHYLQVCGSKIQLLNTIVVTQLENQSSDQSFLETNNKESFSCNVVILVMYMKERKEQLDSKCSTPAAPIDFSGITDCLTLLKMRLILSQQTSILFFPSF